MRNAPLRTGYGLIFRVRPRRCQLGALNDDSFLVVVEPILAGLETRNHGVAAVVEVFGGVLTR
jgi:hypothetical protein